MDDDPIEFISPQPYPHLLLQEFMVYEGCTHLIPNSCKETNNSDMCKYQNIMLSETSRWQAK